MANCEKNCTNSKYLDEAISRIKEKNANEPEFIQAIEDVFGSLAPIIIKNEEEYKKSALLERLAEPERIITFRVPWIDDNGQTRVNRGYRVQFNGSIGPYKGGLRFHPTVNQSIMKFLAFEQIFKNALTGFPIGGGKGGADFDPKDKSETEIMKFCQSFMTELQKHIGQDTDIPAGDIGVGAREIGYLFGQYRRIKNNYEAGVITGKGLDYGGSLVRKEATGYGLIYFMDEMLKANNLNLNNKTVIISGAGNVAIYACEKAQQYGAKVIAMSDSNGCIYDKKGIDLKVLPCATQNDINLNCAKLIVENGACAIGEGANMPTTKEAIDYFLTNNILLAPGKAANAGGVGVSALEMSQNSMRYFWTFEEVDKKLKNFMSNIFHETQKAAAEYGLNKNYVAGANIAAFKKIAQAMQSQGII